MKKTSKIIAMALVGVILLASLAGCTPKSLGTITENETKVATELETKTYLFYAYNQKLNADSYASQNNMTGADLLAQKTTLEGYEDKTYDEYFSITLKEQISNLYIALDLYEKSGMTLSAEDNVAIDEEFASFKEGLGDIAYNKFRSQLQMTDSKMRIFFVNNYKRIAYYSSLVAAGTDKEVKDEAVKAEFDSKYVRIKHILVKNATVDATTQTSKKLEGDALAAAKAKAEKLFADAQAKDANFEKLARYNSEDGAGPDPETDTTEKAEVYQLGQQGGYIVENNGYSFTKESGMVEPFTNAAFEMQLGEIRLVETTAGWHIMKKYDINETDKIFAAVKDTLKTGMQATKITEIEKENATKYAVAIDDKIVEKYKLSKLTSIQVASAK